jgi:hypothetical protein
MMRLPTSGKRPRLAGESANCYELRHKRCAGTFKLNHGQTKKCICPCHKKPKEESSS